jgi:hypothetical protein
MHGHTGGHVGGHIPPPHHQPHQVPHTPVHDRDIWNATLEPSNPRPRRNLVAALIHNPRAASTLLVLTIAVVLILIFAV